MLYGRVVRPPSLTAKLLSVDEAAVKKLPGVVAVIRDGNFLAVAAAREEQAIAARQALANNAKWDVPASMPPRGAALYAHLKAAPKQTSIVGVKDNAAVAATAVKKHSAEFTRPFQSHG